MKQLYEDNNDFKEYVDKYSKKHKCTVDQAFTHAMVKEVYEYYKENNK